MKNTAIRVPKSFTAFRRLVKLLIGNELVLRVVEFFHMIVAASENESNVTKAGTKTAVSASLIRYILGLISGG